MVIVLKDTIPFQNIDYEQVPDVPNFREEDSRQVQNPHPWQNDYDDYGQRSQVSGPTSQVLGPTSQVSGPMDYNYNEYEEPRYIEEYADYNIPESRQVVQDTNQNDEGYEDFFASDKDFFGPGFDDFFKKIEGGIEDEIVSSPNYHTYHPRAREWEESSYQPSLDDVAYSDLTPDDFDNNHPGRVTRCDFSKIAKNFRKTPKNKK